MSAWCGLWMKGARQQHHRSGNVRPWHQQFRRRRSSDRQHRPRVPEQEAAALHPCPGLYHIRSPSLVKNINAFSVFAKMNALQLRFSVNLLSPLQWKSVHPGELLKDLTGNLQVLLRFLLCLFAFFFAVFCVVCVAKQCDFELCSPPGI